MLYWIELHIKSAVIAELVKHGKTWTQIAEALPARTPLDIENLYKNHENLIKTLLTQQANLLPSGTNADPILPDLSVFVASVHDHYSALYNIQQRSSEAENESPTILGRTKAVSRTGSAKKKAGKKDSPTKVRVVTLGDVACDLMRGIRPKGNRAGNSNTTKKKRVRTKRAMSRKPRYVT